MIGAIIPITLGGLIFFAFWLWALFDCISTDNVLVRNLPKTTWLFVIILLSLPGSLAWLLLGRPENAGLGLGGTYRPPDYTQRPRSGGFEDSPMWESRRKAIKPPAKSNSPRESNAAKERRLLEWEAELAKREANLDDPDTE
jgi:hypothetical protein